MRYIILDSSLSDFYNSKDIKDTRTGKIFGSFPVASDAEMICNYLNSQESDD